MGRRVQEGTKKQVEGGRKVFGPGARSYGWAIVKESSDFHKGDGLDWPV